MSRHYYTSRSKNGEFWWQHCLRTVIDGLFFFCLWDAGDWCQQRFCECDQAAIDCMTQSSYNSTLRGLAESSCSATNQTGNFIRGETGDSSLINLQSARQQSAPPAPTTDFPSFHGFLCTFNSKILCRVQIKLGSRAKIKYIYEIYLEKQKPTQTYFLHIVFLSENIC